MQGIRPAERHPGIAKLHRPGSVRQDGQPPGVPADDTGQRQRAVRHSAGLEVGPFRPQPVRQRPLQIPAAKKRSESDLGHREYCRRPGGHHPGIHAGGHGGILLGGTGPEGEPWDARECPQGPQQRRHHPAGVSPGRGTPAEDRPVDRAGGAGGIPAVCGRREPANHYPLAERAGHSHQPELPLPAQQLQHHAEKPEVHRRVPLQGRDHPGCGAAHHFQRIV